MYILTLCAIEIIIVHLAVAARILQPSVIVLKQQRRIQPCVHVHLEIPVNIVLAINYAVKRFGIPVRDVAAQDMNSLTVVQPKVDAPANHVDPVVQPGTAVVQMMTAAMIAHVVYHPVP
ncbi:MAG TPA: hypothetical protein ENI45_04490 [Thermoplasmatales archaeon]|nr:hypothetical protein [Thermoplasmatales archaeon]